MQARCLLFNFPGIPGVRCAFGQRLDENLGGNISYRNGEAQAVSRARSAFFAAAGAPGRVAETEQVHGVELVADPAGGEPAREPASLEKADGLMSAEKGLALLIKTADCQPILLADKEGRHIMAIHVGWRGNRAKFPQKAVAAFCERYGLRPDYLAAVRGPSLGPESARFENFATEWPEEFAPWFDARSGLMDLWALTRAQLAEAGLPQGAIYGIDVCTMKNSAFFSWRRDKSPGRQGSIIWIEEP